MNASFSRSLFILSIVSMAGIAQADVVSTTYPLTPYSMGQFGPVSNTFSVDVTQFDPALGTLDSITVAWDMTLSGGGEDDGSGDGGAIVNGGGPVSINGAVYNGFGLSGGNNAAEPGDTFAFSSPGGVTSTVSPGNGVSQATFDSTIGLGTVPFAYAFSGTFSGGSVITASAGITGSVQVDYNFTPVPEPTSLGLLGAIGMIALRRKTSNQ